MPQPPLAVIGASVFWGWLGLELVAVGGRLHSAEAFRSVAAPWYGLFSALPPVVPYRIIIGLLRSFFFVGRIPLHPPRGKGSAPLRLLIGCLRRFFIYSLSVIRSYTKRIKKSG
jgi:hypothetical protein